MREDFLHFVWQYQQFNTHSLITTQGQALTILRVGKLNSHAGPDFYEAHLILDDIKFSDNGYNLIFKAENGQKIILTNPFKLSPEDAEKISLLPVEITQESLQLIEKMLNK